MKQKESTEREWVNPPRVGNESILFYIDLVRNYCDRIEEILNETKSNKLTDISEYKMKKEMHWIQKGLLNLNRKGMLTGKGYRKIARFIGIEHPQQIKYHLTQLKKHNLL